MKYKKWGEAMTTDELKHLLESYTKFKSLIKLKSIRIEEIQKQREYANQEYIEADAVAIEGLSLRAPVLSDIPKSVTNKFNSTTENVAIAYNQDKHHRNDFDVTDLKCEEYQLQGDIEQLTRDVAKVDALIASLGDKHKFVICKYYFQKYNYSDIAKQYSETFRLNYISVNYLKEINAKALRKMVEIT